MDTDFNINWSKSNKVIYEDGIKVNINVDKYFIIYDYDIRFYDYNKKLLLEINTYPIKPNEFLSNNYLKFN